VWASGGGSGHTKASVNKVPQADDTVAPAAQEVTEKKGPGAQLPPSPSMQPKTLDIQYRQLQVLW
jgi:hypothetical protein